MEILIDDLNSGEVAGLLEEHLAEMKTHSPPESVHALDPTALKSPDTTFWSAWIDGEIAGCGALKEIDKQHGEIKSMRTSKNHRRKGVAAGILKQILIEAKMRSYSVISLETGSMAAFLPARELYQRFGFRDCPPFADYKEDPNSVFMSKRLD